MVSKEKDPHFRAIRPSEGEPEGGLQGHGKHPLTVVFGDAPSDEFTPTGLQPPFFEEHLGMLHGRNVVAIWFHMEEREASGFWYRPTGSCWKQSKRPKWLYLPSRGCRGSGGSNRNPSFGLRRPGSHASQDPRTDSKGVYPGEASSGGLQARYRTLKEESG